MNRRRFLGSSAAALAAVAAKPASKAPVIDAHVHCFAGKDDRRFPYHEKAPYQPDDAATPQALLEAMDAAGVAGAVIVHPEPYQDDHHYLEYCLKVDPKRLKGTCLFFADRPDAPAKLKELAGRCGVVALRIHAYAPERLPPFGKPSLRALWKQATELGLALQLHFEPRYAGGFQPLLDDFPDAVVLIDHLGRPFQGSPEEHARVLQWAKRKNTYLKLSSIPSPKVYPHRDPTPVVKQLVDAYGPERLIYGGGWGAGVSGREYRAARQRVASFLGDLTEAQRAQVLGGNAARLFKFDFAY